jgi:hypothetical protein
MGYLKKIKREKRQSKNSDLSDQFQYTNYKIVIII